MRTLIYTTAIACFLTCQNDRKVQKSDEMDMPNIVILLADDLGYGDLGCYGGVAQTPNLDRLAKEGIRLTDFYAAAPNCSPSRAGMLTGRYATKVGMYNYMSPGHPMHLKEEEVTIAEIVKQKGYATGHFGKWHVSNLTPDKDLGQPQPDDQGFDYSLGTTNNSRPSHLNPVNFVRNGTKTGEMKGYSCQIIVDEAIHWLKQEKDPKTPFLLYMAFHEPHLKLASPPELIENYSQYSEKDAEYYANVENMDLAIGKLLTVLKEQGLGNNTLILFASDNGSYHNGSNGKLLGGKSFVYEGGIRVPGILHWKGVIKAGQTIDQPASLVDIMPTICELTGIEHPKKVRLDGVSLTPLLLGKTLERSNPLSWFFYRTSPQMAMRFGNYVLLGRSLDTIRHTHPTSQPDMDYIKELSLDAFELYDLKNDIEQAHNLNLTNIENGDNYKEMMKNRLKELQDTGPYWNNLPSATGTRKLKTEWRKLRPTGFSN